MSKSFTMIDDKSVPNYQGFDDDVASEVRSLARSLNGTSTDEKAIFRTFSNMSLIPGVNPMCEDQIHPKLDPDSDAFDSKFWIKNLRKMYDSDPAYYKPLSLGVAFKDLRVYGRATDADYQSDFANVVYKLFSRMIKKYMDRYKEAAKFDILKSMDGLLKPGEFTVVLGRPGAGCTTFLKTIASHTHGFNVDKTSIISYDGLNPKDINNHFRGDAVYCAETESHFPQLTVGQTLDFAARMRTPQNRPKGITREQYATHITKVIMATYELSHTVNTRVGDDFVIGVSGGERKRVSIAEVALSFASLQCWDNSTRGLDSATALEFIRALKTSATVLNATPMIAIYQCSQDAYDLFDKVKVI